MSYCEIKLVGTGRPISGGDTIQGTVKCFFKNEKKTRGIRIKLKGEEHTHWSEQESYYDSHDKKTRYRTVHYHGDHIFIRDEIRLTEQGTLPAGYHEYPFSFILREHLVGSFRNQYGSISYKIKATVDIPWKADYESVVELNVQGSPIDFSRMNPNLQKPIQWSDEKTICCFCCQSGPINFDLILSKEAFIPGETINAKIECTNLSNVNVSGVMVEVQTTIESKTTTPRTHTKEETETVVRAQETGVGAHGERTYDIELYIPPELPVYNFDNSTLFKQYFDIKATCQIDGCHSNIDIGGPLKFGHIPYGPPPSIARPTMSQQIATHEIGFAVPPQLETCITSPVMVDGFAVIQDEHTIEERKLYPPPQPMPQPYGVYPPSEFMPTAPVNLMAPSAPLSACGTPRGSMPPPSYDQAIKSEFALPPNVGK